MKVSGQEDYYERRLSFLPEERRTQVREALEKYDEAERKIQERDGVETGTLTASERSKLQVRLLVSLYPGQSCPCRRPCPFDRCAC